MPGVLRSPLSRILAVTAIALPLACDDDPTPVAPPEANGAPGQVSVHTVTSGRWIPDGDLQILFDSDPATVRRIGFNGSTEFTLSPGDHEVELFRGQGRAFYPACDVEGGLTREVTIEPGTAALAEFELYCEVALKLTASTSGVDPDPDGYRLLVGPPFVTDRDFSFEPRSLAGDEPLILDRSSSFWWFEQNPETYVYTWDVAPNCTLTGPNPLMFATGGGVTEHELNVECVDASPSIGTLFFLDRRVGQVFSVEADGSGMTQVTDGPHVEYWALSPDGTEIVYAPVDDGGLLRVAVDGTGLTRIAPDDGLNNEDLHWGVDGRILFTEFTEADGQFDIYSIRADGGDRRRLTTEGGSAGSLSPGGTSIVFEGPDGVSRMDPDGSNVEAIVPGENLVLRVPRWSPDGSRVAGALRSEISFEYRIAILDPATGELTIAAEKPLRSLVVFAWSPAGDRLVYHAPQDGVDFPVDFDHGGDFFTASADGSNLERLTNIDVRASDIDWRD